MNKTYTITLTMTVEDEAVIAKLDEPGVIEDIGKSLSTMLQFYVRDALAPWSVTVPAE